METRGKGARRADGTRGDPPVLPAGLSRVNLNAAGIDVGAESHFVAVPEDRSDTPVREFAAFTGDLYRLADWLAECGIETVALESTGVYWLPLFGVLEERGFEVLLVDPRGIKNAPGRKTDVLDSQWTSSSFTPTGCSPGPSVPMRISADCAATCGSEPCWSRTRPDTFSTCRRP